MSDYPSIRIRAYLARFAAARPSLDWQASSPALARAEGELNRAILAFRETGDAQRVEQAARAWTRELEAAQPERQLRLA